MARRDGPSPRQEATSEPAQETSPKQRKREREIIEAATEIFRRQGYSDTSIQDIADSVGMLKGSLYYYIKSKEDLLFRVLSETYEAARTPVDEVLAMTDVPPLERLYFYVTRHVEFSTSHITKIAIYYHDFGLLGDERRKIIVDQRAVFEELIAGLIAEARDRGDVDASIDPKVAAFLVLGMLNWIYTWYDPDGPMSGPQLAHLAAELVLNGLEGAVPGSADPAEGAPVTRAASGPRRRVRPQP